VENENLKWEMNVEGKEGRSFIARNMCGDKGQAGRQERNISDLEVVAVAASAPFWSCLLADVDPTNQLGRT
jgi:hypothetical protein